MLPVAQKYGMGTLACGPLGQALLTGRVRKDGQNDLRRAQLVRDLNDESRLDVVEKLIPLADKAGATYDPPRNGSSPRLSVDRLRLERGSCGLKRRSYPPHPPPPDSTSHTKCPTTRLSHHRSPSVRVTNRVTRRRWPPACPGSSVGEGARSGPRRTPSPTWSGLLLADVVGSLVSGRGTWVALVIQSACPACIKPGTVHARHRACRTPLCWTPLAAAWPALGARIAP
jgi:hypothetical protein